MHESKPGDEFESVDFQLQSDRNIVNELNITMAILALGTKIKRVSKLESRYYAGVNTRGLNGELYTNCVATV